MVPLKALVWPIKNGGNLLANATVIIQLESGDIKISRVQVVRSAGGSRFISLPQIPYLKNGETRYSKVIELSSQLMDNIESQIFKELDRVKQHSVEVGDSSTEGEGERES